MKLKDEFYKDPYGIGGLRLDMPTKRPKKKEESDFEIGQMIRCVVEEFIYPVRGYIEKINTNSAIIRIENTVACDEALAMQKKNVAVARLSDIESFPSK
ncbi:hypothetical protein ACOYX0_12800 [Enterococcus thailandicus]|uniref:ArpT n=1 Tax=Enterococcus thailandicus TaxID=417368 RepID=A0A510WGU2_ENTTH|nr:MULTISPECIES: hypothetical protein [Enterococcus]OTP23847.1 hypothetical protein A5800_001704 [Enterococcus sp. 5B7_DIV0075]GEK38157.1 hypothetical protein ETH01_24440 [Enterococcus thailandicus]